MQLLSPTPPIAKFLVRMPDDLRDRLAAQARANRRSMNSELLMLVEAALDDVAASRGLPSAREPEVENA